ncbi:MAG TPA: hypothetical protein PLM06_11815 [Anaerolineae bacterium]|nr:hypothetical protein [Anaerolineae bacterium]
MNDFPFEIFFIFIGLAIVGLTAWLVSMFRRSSGEQGRADKKSAAQPATLAVRVNQQGLWEVVVDGIVYRSLEAVPDPVAQKQVVDALKILAGFSRSYMQKQRAQTSAADVGSLETTTGLPPVPGAALREPGLSRPSTAPIFIPQINLAKEIEEIAKELQAQVPALAHTTLRLQNAPGGGVIFFVNEQLYQNLEDIPDPAVQALIRAATRQWEKR